MPFAFGTCVYHVTLILPLRTRSPFGYVAFAFVPLFVVTFGRSLVVHLLLPHVGYVVAFYVCYFGVFVDLRSPFTFAITAVLLIRWNVATLRLRLRLRVPRYVCLPLPAFDTFTTHAFTDCCWGATEGRTRGIPDHAALPFCTLILRSFTDLRYV